jgi:hypothetical protein
MITPNNGGSLIWRKGAMAKLEPGAAIDGYPAAPD